MKLYFYSNELFDFIESKRVKIKFLAIGILLGAIVPFIAGILNPSMLNVLGSRSTKILTSDNGFLRQQVSQISLKVNDLEMRARQLNERSEKLRMLFQGRRIVEDTVSSAANMVKEEKFQPLLSVAESYHP